MTTLGDIGELAAIKRVRQRLPVSDNVLVGAGDDCAVLRFGAPGGDDWVVTSDPVIEGVHFDLGTDACAVGHKAVGRVLSDIAAMGGRPLWALIDFVAPRRTPVAVLDGVYSGALALAGRHGLSIVGGDTSSGPVLEVHVFAAGTVPAGRAVLRSGACAGDLLFVTGALGGSRLGRHLAVEPRIEEGQWLREWATSMIDLSDGLASDLRQLTTFSRVGCLLNGAAVPIAPAACRMPDGLPPLDHALHDGEDFELLFTVPEEREDAFAAAWDARFDLPCTRIGVMTGDVDLVECVFESGEAVALEGMGFTHFES